MSAPKLSVYVCGASSEPARVRAAMGAVSAIPGCVVALDWLAPIEAGATANAGHSRADRIQYAEADLAAVASAHALWLLVPNTPSFGAGAEFGYSLAARAAGIRIAIIASGSIERSIFTSLADEVPRDSDALLLIRDLAVQHAQSEAKRRRPPVQCATCLKLCTAPSDVASVIATGKCEPCAEVST